MKMMERKAYTAFSETGFGEMGFGKTGFSETGRHRLLHTLTAAAAIGFLPHVWLSSSPHDISKKPMQLGSPHLT